MSCISRAKSRVVVTGMGAVTPIGIGVPSYWEHLLDGTEGTGPVTRFDTADLPVHVMAEVKGFDPDRRISRISCKGKCRCLPNIPTLRPKKPLPTPLYRGTPIGWGW